MFYRAASATLLLVVMLAFGSTAAASQGDVDGQVAAMLEARKRSPGEIKSLLSQLSESQKEQLIRQQGIIDDIVQRSPNPSDLTPDQRQTLWNATKAIDSIIAQDRHVADEQLHCRQERKIGSQLARRKCRTKAEMERDRDDARRQLDGQQSRIQTRI